MCASVSTPIREQHDENDDEEDSPAGDPCPHCDAFLVIYNDDPSNVVCPRCHLTPDGALDTPSWDYDDADEHVYRTYRKSRKAVLFGAYPAYIGDSNYGLGDGTADYDTFLSS